MIHFFGLAVTSTPDTSGTDTTKVYNVPTVDPNTIFTNGLNIAYFLLGAIAVIIIIVSGILYATSAGNSSQITRAKNALTYAIVGLVIVLLAFTITQFITGRF